MAKAFKRAQNCGPVPYPDGSGRMLTDEIVVGEEWAPFVELGYLVRIEGEVDPAMFEEDCPPEPLPPPVRPAHVGPTVAEMVEEAAKKERTQEEEKEAPKKNPTVMELARATAKAQGIKPTTVREAARETLRDRGTRMTDVSGGAQDELRPSDDGAGAEAVDS